MKYIKPKRTLDFGDERTRPYAIWNLGMLGHNLIAMASLGGIIKVYNFKTNKVIYKMSPRNGQTYCVVNPVGQRLVSSHNDGTINIWDIASKCRKYNLKKHTYAVVHLAILNKDMIASCSYDKTIKIWNTSTGVCIMTLIGHEEFVCHAIQLPDKRLASASEDGTIRIWNWIKGTCEQTIVVDRVNITLFRYPRELAVFSDGTLISRSSIDYDIIFWKLEGSSYVKSGQFKKYGCHGMLVYQRNKLLVGAQYSIELIDRTGDILAACAPQMNYVGFIVDCGDGDVMTCTYSKFVRIYSLKKFWMVCFLSLQCTNNCLPRNPKPLRLGYA